MATDGAPNVETAPSPAVSSLRSRFEQLAAEKNAALPVPRSTSTLNGLLSPESPSPRPRALSDSDDQRPNQLSLRAANSSSDLKAGTKRPPPPPPPARSSRGSSPAGSVTSSPLLRPIPVPSSVPLLPADSLTPESSQARNALISRKPPPPPPHRIEGSYSSPLINKLGDASITSPVIPPRPSTASDRPISHFSPSASTSSLSARQSPRPISQASPRSLNVHNHPKIQLHSPFDDSDPETPSTTRAPSLPARRPGNGNGTGNGTNHYRDRSADFVASSPGGLSSEGGLSDAEPSPPISVSPRPAPPPRPPPRHKSSLPTPRPSSGSPGPASLNPPPLPARKTTSPHRDSQPPPTRQYSKSEPVDPSDHSTATSPPPGERKKAFNSLPPPPQRTIGLGDKLPPPRRPPSGSSSESEDDEAKAKVDLLPDQSRSSRRPPTIDCHNFSEFNIHVPAYSSAVVVSGHIVAVAAHHRLKIYDLSESDSPILDSDAKSLGLDGKIKDLRITSMEFRPAQQTADRGCFLWMGTKDGHLFELDIRACSIVGMKYSLHSHYVTHMFRHARSMITLDDTGKVLVFSPPPESDEDIWLASTTPRVVRIAEKQEFAKMLNGQLWTSSREAGGNGATSSRGPIVRMYDVLTPGSTGKSLLPSEHLGAVTSGTVLPSQPGQVFLGHEGGHISIWALDTEDGLPQCQEIVKVSSSDVLSMEGVNDRLWAGGRKGMIAAYDVVHRPWVMTNCWMAHEKLPVLRLAVDTWSIEKLHRLCVYSVGRDERLRFWDGLLGTDWIDQELLKREREFSSFRDLNVLIVSWNVDSAKPDQLTGSAANVNFLDEVLHSVECPDIIVFGFQELIDLESRKMAAKTVLLGGKNKTADGAISQRVTSSYKKWYDHLVLAVRLAMPPETPYTVIHTENLVGLFSCIFVKNTERISLKHVAITTIKRGMGGRYGNKGGIVARFVIDDSSMCFINCHLAAGQSHVRQRNADVAAILEEKSVFPESDAVEEPLAYVNGGDGSMVLDHEIVFINGDMNYRIDLRRDAVIADIKAANFAHLLSQDQLHKEMKNNRGFRLRSFIEGPLTFPPTYKYDRRSNEYDTSEKRRTPAWCDRILWRSRDPSRVEQLHYQRYEADISDHRPISAGFRMTVKSVHHESRARVKADVEVIWASYEAQLLQAAEQFYIQQAMI